MISVLVCLPVVYSIIKVSEHSVRLVLDLRFLSVGSILQKSVGIVVFPDSDIEGRKAVIDGDEADPCSFDPFLQDCRLLSEGLEMKIPLLLVFLRLSPDNSLAVFIEDIGAVIRIEKLLDLFKIPPLDQVQLSALRVKDISAIQHRDAGHVGSDILPGLVLLPDIRDLDPLQIPVSAVHILKVIEILPVVRDAFPAGQMIG